MSEKSTLFTRRDTTKVIVTNVFNPSCYSVLTKLFSDTDSFIRFKVAHRVDKYNRPESPSLDEHSMQSYLGFILLRFKNHHKADEGLIDIYSVLERKPRTIC